MIDAAPQKIDATADDLSSLASGLTGFTLCEDQSGVSAVWLFRGDEPALFITSDSRDIVFKFEVFTLAIREAQYHNVAAHEGDAEARATVWPFTNWQVDVLWIRDWSIPVEAIPDGWYASADARRFGKVPDGADHACLVAKAVLFTASDGTRMIIDQGEMPLDLFVTADAKIIDQLMIGAKAQPLHQYLAGALPSIGGKVS